MLIIPGGGSIKSTIVIGYSLVVEGTTLWLSRLVFGVKVNWLRGMD